MGLDLFSHIERPMKLALSRARLGPHLYSPTSWIWLSRSSEGWLRWSPALDRGKAPTRATRSPSYQQDLLGGDMMLEHEHGPSEIFLQPAMRPRVFNKPTT